MDTTTRGHRPLLARVEFWLRTPVPDQHGRFYYDKIEIGGGISDYCQPMLNVPAVGDFVDLIETVGDVHGHFRVITRCWRPVLFGHPTDWAGTAPQPGVGDRVACIVERAGDGYERPEFPGWTDRPEDSDAPPDRIA